jgi:hypothetical protein
LYRGGKLFNDSHLYNLRITKTRRYLCFLTTVDLIYQSVPPAPPLYFHDHSWYYLGVSSAFFFGPENKIVAGVLLLRRKKGR